MDFGMCFVVVLVMLLFIVAWIDDQRTKEEEMPGLQRGGAALFFLQRCHASCNDFHNEYNDCCLNHCCSTTG
jgi:hypothetical protein